MFADFELNRVRGILERMDGAAPDPSGVEIDSLDLPNCSAEWIRPLDCRSDRTVLYLPGGAWVLRSERIHRRLGLTRHEDPVKIERDLMQLVPEPHWTLYSHQVIHHGRVCCDSRRPRCEICPLRPECPWPGSREGRRAIRGRRAS